MLFFESNILYVQQLSSIPEMSNSEDWQEFLALHSDATRYFGRKPFAKSRIDKVRNIYLCLYSFFNLIIKNDI